MKIHHLFALASFAAQTLHAAPPKPNAAPKADVKCDITIDGTDTMQFHVDGKKVDSITVPLSCEKFVVTLNHTGKLPKAVMGHNFVVTASADASLISAEASKLGSVPKGYLPDEADMKTEPFKSKVIATSKLLLGADGPKTEKITIDTNDKRLKMDGKYTFFCTFPGHFAVMQGELKVVK